ncbi:hypothetical protein ACHAXT_004873 [Thalassiosira profunda]
MNAPQDEKKEAQPEGQGQDRPGARAAAAVASDGAPNEQLASPYHERKRFSQRLRRKMALAPALPRAATGPLAARTTPMAASKSVGAQPGTFDERLRAKLLSSSRAGEALTDNSHGAKLSRKISGGGQGNRANAPAAYEARIRAKANGNGDAGTPSGPARITAKSQSSVAAVDNAGGVGERSSQVQPAASSPSLQRRNDIEARITAKSQSSVTVAEGAGERISSQRQPAVSSSLPNGTNDIETASSGVLQAEVSASLRRLNDAEERIRAKTTSSGGEPALAQIMEEGDSRRCLDSTVKSVDDTFAMEVPSAVVVGDEVFDAEPISDDVLKGTRAKRWRLAAAAAVLLMVVAIAIMAPLLSKKEEPDSVVVLVSSMAVPSAVPSSAPSFDPSPTLQRLCRAVAAVVLGSPEKIVKVATDSKTRWTSLLDRLTDLSVFGDTHTIEREIREKGTGTGFTFTKPFMYDGMVFGGKEEFVRCAEGGIHYGVCAYISICLKADTTHQDYVEANFPSDFYRLVPTSTLEEMIDLTFAGECNVIAYERNVLLTSRFAEGIADGTTGLFYALPFGNLDRLAESENSFRAPYGDGLNNVMEKGKLDCGVVVETHQNDSVEALNTDLCRTLAASLFYGDAADVNITVFHSKDEAFASLGNGTIDVAAGLAVEKGPDFAGYHFSDPYLYVASADDQPVSSIAFATRDDDRLLSSYVSTVVMASVLGS